MRTSSHARLSRPICNRWRKPPWCQKRAVLRRLQIDCQIAQPHRFIPLFDPTGVFRFVRPELRVPITQNWKDRHHKSDTNRCPRFDRLEQIRKRNREDRNKKICPASLPNRQAISRDEKSQDGRRQERSFSKTEPNKKRRDQK